MYPPEVWSTIARRLGLRRGPCFTRCSTACLISWSTGGWIGPHHVMTCAFIAASRSAAFFFSCSLTMTLAERCAFLVPIVVGQYTISPSAPPPLFWQSFFACVVTVPLLSLYRPWKPRASTMQLLLDSWCRLDRLEREAACHPNAGRSDLRLQSAPGDLDRVVVWVCLLVKAFSFRCTLVCNGICGEVKTRPHAVCLLVQGLVLARGGMV